MLQRGRDATRSPSRCQGDASALLARLMLHNTVTGGSGRTTTCDAGLLARECSPRRND